MLKRSSGRFVVKKQEIDEFELMSVPSFVCGPAATRRGNPE
jgi:hypothetical protein